jgi:hypothetical protein
MIEPNEWREYFFLTPIDDINDLLYHWRYSTVKKRNLFLFIKLSLASVDTNENKIIKNFEYFSFKLVDLGEGNTVPDDFVEGDVSKQLWHVNLFAGAIAGAVSRTSTAPFDRLKTVMMVSKLFSLTLVFFIFFFVQFNSNNNSISITRW